MKKILFSTLLPLFLIFSSVLHAHNFKVLIFSKTQGFRHQSIPNGIAMIQQLGVAEGFTVEATEDASLFTFDNLSQYAAVIFLSTTGDVLNNTQQIAFEQYIQNGGGYVGIHAASDTEYDWAWYGNLVGAYFKDHPSGTPTATIKVADKVHPSTKDLPYSWTRTDEWYNFRTNPRGKVHVLATLDENSYAGGNMGFDHPIAWSHEFDGGRSWYTGGGHTAASYSEPLFVQHVLGGIYYAVGEETGVFDATVEDNYEVSLIDNNPSNPMALAVMPDLKVLYIERAGNMKLYNPTSGSITTAGTFNVDSNREDGLIGLVLDPNFEINNWIYVFYSPAGSVPKQHVSRFTFTGETIDESSEQILLEIPVQREQCCHSGGDLEFDKAGNLYISVGDNTNPFQSGGYTPIDERSNRTSFDAQRTSGNTKDFRGKILRITPQANGTYSIPAGNLFTNANDGYPEIYAMGTRNPFRIALSPDNYLYFGDVGPDAGIDSANRGPRGHDEFNRTNTAANFGWPYCIADNQSYVDYNFATSSSGSAFDCDNLVNNSPNNTGSAALPAAKSAWIWYNGGDSTEFPELNAPGGRTAMAGAVYEYNAASSSQIKFPEYFHNSVFIYEWSRNWIKEVKLDAAGNIVKINPFYSSLNLKRPIDMDFGPDGAMYIIEWGTGFGGNNADARIVKVSFKQGNQVPNAIATAAPQSGAVPLIVNFDASQSFDPDSGDTLTYEWDFEGDGTFEATGITTSHTYTTNGNFSAILKVTDSEGLTGFSTVEISAGNTIPNVTVTYPVDGGFYIWGEEVPFKVEVIDTEDGSTFDSSIACNEVTGLPSIGHDDHSHDSNAVANCEGSFVTQSHGEEADNVFYVFKGSYTDKGASGVNPITGTATNILQPKKKEAEHFSSQSGIQVENTSDVLGGGRNVGFINNNDYLSFTPMNLQDITHITLRAASNVNGGFVEVRSGSPTGTLVGKRFIPVTGGWQNWDYFSMPIEDPRGTNELFFVFKGNNGFLFNLNWIEFHGKGIAAVDLYAGNGLNASYYNSTDFSGTAITTKDPMVAFDWGTSAPVNGVNSDGFSARWEGFIKVDKSKDYTFFTEHQGGAVKVFLDGNQILNNTTDGEVSSSVFSLTAGQFYNLKIEYIHTSGIAAVSLGWAKNQTVYLSNLSIGDTSLSVNEEALNDNVQVYPNPFTNDLNVTIKNTLDKPTIKLFSASGASLGNLVIHKTSANEFKIDISNYKSGFYFLKVETAQGTVIKKLMKK